MPGRTLSTRIITASLTIPTPNTAGGPVWTRNVDLGQVTINTVQVIIPEGHAGLTGLQIWYANQIILPWDDPDSYLVGDGEETTFPVDFDVSGLVTLKGINNGVYYHTFYLRFTVTDWELPTVRRGVALRAL